MTNARTATKATPSEKKRAIAPAGVPVRTQDSSVEENIGAGLGVVAGAAAGSIGGPIGMIVGATLGSIVGDAAGAIIHERDAAASKRDHELDDAIGVTSGPIGVQEVLEFPSPPKLATFLRADHDELEALAAGVLEAIVGGDRELVGETLALLQTRVVAHLDGEERDLIPDYQAYSPEDAKALLREHAEIRQALAELDVGVDLHLVRAGAVGALLTKLQEHAKRENTGLLRWAAARDSVA